MRIVMTLMRKSRTLRIASVQALIFGIEKHLASASLRVDNTAYASADLVSKLQGQVTADNAIIAAAASYHEAVKVDEDLAMGPFLVKLTQAIRIMYASAPSVLADFGVAPPKPRSVDPDAKVLAAARARATRELRHTMGPVQNESIKGTVTSVTVTDKGSTSDASAPPAAAAEVAPAPAAPVNGTSGSPRPVV